MSGFNHVKMDCDYQTYISSGLDFLKHIEMADNWEQCLSLYKYITVLHDSLDFSKFTDPLHETNVNLLFSKIESIYSELEPRMLEKVDAVKIIGTARSLNASLNDVLKFDKLSRSEAANILTLLNEINPDKDYIFKIVPLSYVLFEVKGA